jgi:hypothetical protein
MVHVDTVRDQVIEGLPKRPPLPEDWHLCARKDTPKKIAPLS